METEATPAVLPLADIAAYWGAAYRCSYHNMESYPFLFDEEWVINADILAAIPRLNLLDFKLHLKPLSSLTDEQIREVYALEYSGRQTKDKVYRKDHEIGIYHGWGTSTTLFVRNQNDTIWDMYDGYRKAATVRYLQRNHYFVPGTIDPQFVHLIEP